MHELDAVDVVFAIVLTWVIGLTPPLAIRYAILRRPIDRWPAVGICGFFWLFNLFLFIALGSRSKSHAALMFIALISYWILRKTRKPNEHAEHRGVVESLRDGAIPTLTAVATQADAMEKQKRAFARATIQPAKRRERPFAINPFLCKSEGMRRLSIVLSVVSVLAWVTFAWVESDGFKLVEPRDWVFLFGAPFVAYLLVMVLRLVALWLLAGFRNEAHP